MTFFGQIGTGLGTFFILLSLLNVYYGLRVAGSLRQRWGEFQREPLQAWQKSIIDRSAFFLGVPLGVVVHELSHVINNRLSKDKSSIKPSFDTDKDKDMDTYANLPEEVNSFLRQALSFVITDYKKNPDKYRTFDVFNKDWLSGNCRGQG